MNSLMKSTDISKIRRKVIRGRKKQKDDKNGKTYRKRPIKRPVREKPNKKNNLKHEFAKDNSREKSKIS